MYQIRMHSLFVLTPLEFLSKFQNVLGQKVTSGFSQKYSDLTLLLRTEAALDGGSKLLEERNTGNRLMEW